MNNATLIVRALLALLGAVVGTVLLLPIVLLGGPLWLVASLTRLGGRLRSSGRPSGVLWQELMQFEPEVGWKPRPNLDTHALAERPFHLTTDTDGWRGRGSLAESQLVVFGDSFAFGHGIDDRDWYGSVARGVRIKAIGANGYSMVQPLLWMRRLADQLGGKLVVWFIYHGNDLYENLQPHLDRYRMPFVRAAAGTQRWEICSRHVSSRPWPGTARRQYYCRLAEICSPTYLAERAFSACDFLIAGADELCRGIGAGLVVMTIPDVTQISPSHREVLRSVAPDADRLDLDRPDREIAAICERLGVPLVALKNHLDASDYQTTDVHWNRNGHARVAELLARVHRQHAREHTPAVRRAAP